VTFFNFFFFVSQHHRPNFYYYYSAAMAVLAQVLDSPYLIQGVVVALLAVLVSSFWDDLSDEIPYRRVPLVGKNWWSDLTNKKAKARFSQGARALIAGGFSRVSPPPNDNKVHRGGMLIMLARADMSSRLWAHRGR
jgi:hypothetical protein